MTILINNMVSQEEEQGSRRPISSPVMTMFWALRELYKDNDPSYGRAKRHIIKAIESTGYTVATSESKSFLIRDEEDLGGKIEIIDQFTF